jgi:uncharacterized XkdX family phage protein
MDWFKTIKDYYDTGRYTKEQVAVFVVKGKITAAQYQEITGDVYAA